MSIVALWATCCLLTFDPPKLDHEEKEEIEKLISELEILRAIQEQKDNKSPCEDGLTSEVLFSLHRWYNSSTS